MGINFSEEIDMFQCGMLPQSTLVTFVMKKILESEDGRNFETLPEWLKKLIVEDVNDYRSTGVWKIISNNGAEDFGPIAKEFSLLLE